MLYLTSEIQKQFQNIIEEVDWLSSSTKDTARYKHITILLKFERNKVKSFRNKLDAMIHNIGYPDLVLNDTELYQEIDGVSFIYHISLITIEGKRII